MAWVPQEDFEQIIINHQNIKANESLIAAEEKQLEQHLETYKDLIHDMAEDRDIETKIKLLSNQMLGSRACIIGAKKQLKIAQHRLQMALTPFFQYFKSTPNKGRKQFHHNGWLLTIEQLFPKIDISSDLRYFLEQIDDLDNLNRYQSRKSEMTSLSSKDS